MPVDAAWEQHKPVKVVGQADLKLLVNSASERGLRFCSLVTTDSPVHNIIIKNSLLISFSILLISRPRFFKR